MYILNILYTFETKPIYLCKYTFIYVYMYIYTNIKISIHIYIVLYILKLSIYTIPETTEPANKIYWLNLQVEPKPIYICI